MKRVTRATLRGVAMACAGAVVLTGCDTSIYSLPLPGGPDVGEQPMEIEVEFADVLDLVPQSTVKVNDVSVGKVSAIDLDGYTAVATLELRDDVELPDNALAQLRQTSLLGEKFVSLEEPASGASGNMLSDGDKIPLKRSGRNPEVEEVLGALSLLLNGGGVAQLKTITQELNNALEGREGAAKSVFRQLRTFMAQLDANKGDIINAIENLNRLAVEAKRQLPTIDAALEELPSALRSIDRQRDDLVRMLRSLNDLSDVAIGVIRDSKANTIESLEQLSPVLNQLAASGDDLVDALNVALTFPFVDEVVGRDPQVARNLHMGDYTNLSATLDLDLNGLGSIPNPVDAVCTTLQDVRDQLGANPSLDEVLGVIDGIGRLCKGANRVLNRCLRKDDPRKIRTCLQNTLSTTIQRLTEDTLDSICELLDLNRRQCRRLKAPLLGGLGNLGGSGGNGGPGGDGGLLGGLGLPRAGVGADRGSSSGPTYGQMMEAYDPALVSMLVPGMVTQ